MCCDVMLPHIVYFFHPCPVSQRNKGWQLEQLPASGGEVSSGKKEGMEGVKPGKQVRCSHSRGPCEMSQAY